MKRLVAIALASVLVTFVAACPRHHVRHKPKPHVKHHGTVVVIPAKHKHSHQCGHYHYRGKWYHHGGHVHRHKCGHALRKGIWVRID